MANRFALQEMFEQVFQEERKHQMETWTYTKELKVWEFVNMWVHTK